MSALLLTRVTSVHRLASDMADSEHVIIDLHNILVHAETHCKLPSFPGQAISDTHGLIAYNTHAQSSDSTPSYLQG